MSRAQCTECGAYLPDEIEDGTGVYCPECGTGQHPVVTDGGMNGLPPQIPDDAFASAWRSKANDNLREWGEQDLETLLLAAQEELGELTRAVLEVEHEDGDRPDIQREIDDLGALIFQIQHAYQSERPEIVTDGGRDLDREPRDGESRDGNGGIRPVPPGVEPPEEADR
jgi:NTP pyrophosphatase (non-canonical NTP hydrolase)